MSTIVARAHLAALHQIVELLERRRTNNLGIGRPEATTRSLANTWRTSLLVTGKALGWVGRVGMKLVAGGTLVQAMDRVVPILVIDNVGIVEPGAQPRLACVAVRTTHEGSIEEGSRVGVPVPIVQRQVRVGLAQHCLEPVAQFAMPRQECGTAVHVGRLMNFVLFEP